ncbi:MAG: SIMPL domain-containing protein [Oscillospiraceae bacterium]|nr:SIMPL domain-containing protein [Oscillospiraceae bacterium]
MMTMNNRELVVKGIGKAVVAPDLIVLGMDLEVIGRDYEKTMRRSAEMLDALRAAIVSAGHDGAKLKTTNFNINTKYESYRENGSHKQRFVGYACSHNLKLEFDLDMPALGATLGAIAGCEANPSFNIRFSIKDPAAVSEALLASAVENAKWKAMVLARAAGVTLGAIQRIEYNWSDLHPFSQTNYQVRDTVVREAAAPMAMNIEPKDIDMRDTATVIWMIA